MNSLFSFIKKTNPSLCWFHPPKRAEAARSTCQLKSERVKNLTLTIEEKAGVLNAQSIGSHAGVVPIVLVGDVGDH